MNGKGIAKCLCGFETFHALVAAYFLASGTTVAVLGPR